MDRPSSQTLLERLASELRRGDPVLSRVWGHRARWQVHLRWLAPPVIALVAGMARWLGFEFPIGPVLLVAAGVLAYNSLLALALSRETDEQMRRRSRDRFFTILSVSLDYVTMLLLTFYTGGAASPLLFFFIFHIIIAAIQSRPTNAYLFAALAVAGVWILGGLQMGGLIECPTLGYRGRVPAIADDAAHLALSLGTFTATVLVTATIGTLVMGRLRERVWNLADATRQVVSLNQKLSSLYTMVRAVGSEHHLTSVLDIVTSELAGALGVDAVAVKLLSEDRQTLRFVAAHGLPREFMDKNVVQLSHSPLNREVIEGRAVVHGHLGTEKSFQLHDDLRALGIESTVFVPLTLEDRVIGILGAYSTIRNRFGGEEIDFLKLAAELTAIAAENARAYEEIESLMAENVKFTMQVAHNLRAPLGASLSMLELLSEGDLGPVIESQREYLGRITHRLQLLNQTVGELLTIGRTRDWSREIVDVEIDLAELASHVEQTFRDEATRQGLTLAVKIQDGLPAVESGADLLQQVMENLVSNSIKYTPQGGRIDVGFSHGQSGEVQIVVQDTGIGIPANEQARLCSEFFRASNARRLRTVGTGLGLALVKRAVERHRGRMFLASEEGEGTTITIDLPVRQANARAPGKG